jgi:hypothetical protein
VVLAQSRDIPTSVLRQTIIEAMLLIELVTLGCQRLCLPLNGRGRRFEGFDRASEVVFQHSPGRSKRWVVENGVKGA